MSSLSVSVKRRRAETKSKFKVMGKHDEFLSRIKKTLYYGKLPLTERFSLPVTELAAELYTEVKNGKSLERLDLEEAAAMSRNACVSPCSLVLALLYLERLKTCNPDYLQRVAPSELFLVSMMIASKFLHDDGEADEVFNDEWATSAGITVKELNRFERDFLQAIKWEVFVSEQAFWTRLCRMERDVALKEGRRRGWFSYSDLENLLDTVDVAALTQTLITVSAVCLTSYTAGVLTLLGSAFIASQLPGLPISSSLSSPSCSIPQEAPVNNSMDQPVSQTLPAVLTTSFILASLSSSPSEKEPEAEFPCHSISKTACYCQHYPSNNSENTVSELGNNGWTELFVEWSKYVSWQWWKLELGQLLARQPLVNESKATPHKLTSKFKSKDVSNRSGFGSRSRHIEDRNEAQVDSQEWVTELRNWLDQTALQRSSQTTFFPLEIATSNY